MGSGTAAPPAFSSRRLDEVGRRIELQEAVPDRRHAGAPGDALGRDQLGQPLRGEVGTGQDLPRPQHRGDVRDAPGHRVEHRHHRHHRVGLANAHRVGQRRAEGVEDDRAVRVQHPLGPAGGAARVAHRRRRVLVELGELESRVAACHQLLVVERSLALAGAVRHQDLALGALEARHRRRQRGVEEDQAVVRVLDDVAEVLLEQPDVERVEHGARARHREVELQVAERVPGEARDPIAGPHSQPGERAGQAPGPLDDPSVGRALDALLGPRDHLAVPEHRLRSLRDLLDEQRAIHHQPVHRIILLGRNRTDARSLCASGDAS